MGNNSDMPLFEFNNKQDADIIEEQQDAPKIFDKFSNDAEITIYCGRTEDFLKTFPDGKIDLVVTSPPYNIGKEYETRKSIDEYLAIQKGVIAELVRVMSDTGSICWQVGNFVNNGEIFPLDIYYYDIFKDFGLQLRNRIIWYFGHGLHAKKRFSGRYETILWFSKNDKYKFFLDNVRVPSKYPGKRHYKGENKGKPSCNPLGKNPSDIWDFVAKEWDQELWNIPNVKSNHPEKTGHPCQYPIELVERCILALTEKGDLVMDPYSGVGSSLIAGIKHGRKVIGSEKEQEYVDIAKERIVHFFEGRLKIRPLTKEVHIPTGKEKVSQIPSEWKNEG